ncbi:hypothetical protein HDU92_000935 [Lobulomyces angularis]|nr:hypothetical protein HDU92_000935 [Lobulomyces angularis]
MAEQSRVSIFFSALVFYIAQKTKLVTSNSLCNIKDECTKRLYKNTFMQLNLQTERLLCNMDKDAPVRPIMILALIYVSRLAKVDSSIIDNLPLVWLIAVNLSKKYLMDKNVTKRNNLLRKVFSLENTSRFELLNLVKLETHFLKLINFELFCRREEYEYWERELKRMSLIFFVNQDRFVTSVIN